MSCPLGTIDESTATVVSVQAVATASGLFLTSATVSSESEDGNESDNSDSELTTVLDGEDIDEDGVRNAEDNCPYVYNPGQEDDDQDELGNVCSPCVEESLASPVYFAWNGFLNQINVLSLQNICSSPLDLTARLYNIDGIQTADASLTLSSKSQVDLMVEGLQGFGRDTYGVIEVEFDRDDCLRGSIYYYRTDTASLNEYTQIEFAMALSPQEPMMGPAYSIFDTTQASTNPQEALQYFVPNWVQVANLDDVTRVFTRNIYLDDGRLIDSKTFWVNAHGRHDVQGGHERPGPGYVGLIEILPKEPETRYVAQVFRYSQDSFGGSLPSEYTYALASPAREARSACRWLGVSKAADGENWIVISNASDTDTDYILSLRNAEGDQLDPPSTFTLAAHAQEQLRLDTSFPSGQNGSAEICPLQATALIADSTSYFRDAGTGSILGAYSLPDRLGSCGSHYVSFNSFLLQTNRLRLASLSGGSPRAEISVYDMNGQLLAASSIQSGDSGNGIDLGQPPFSIPTDNLGLVQIEQLESSSPILLTDLLRIREDAGGAVRDLISAIQSR